MLNQNESIGTVKTLPQSVSKSEIIESCFWQYIGKTQRSSRLTNLPGLRWIPDMCGFHQVFVPHLSATSFERYVFCFIHFTVHVTYILYYCTFKMFFLNWDTFRTLISMLTVSHAGLLSLYTRSQYLWILLYNVLEAIILYNV